MKNLTYLNVKLYSLLILNKNIVINYYYYYYYSFLTKKFNKDVNILMFLTYNKIIYFYKKYNL